MKKKLFLTVLEGGNSKVEELHLVKNWHTGGGYNMARDKKCAVSYISSSSYKATSPIMRSHLHDLT
jgi:hypothetical protein